MGGKKNNDTILMKVAINGRWWVSPNATPLSGKVAFVDTVEYFARVANRVFGVRTWRSQHSIYRFIRVPMYI